MKIFISLQEEINGRLDCYYYQPNFVDLEKKIKLKTSKTLGDYVLNIAGGATPNIKYSSKYYAKSENDGIPFLRVQNVTNAGLDFENCKYIKPETHQNLLKRSQVREDYLITKITGVGRMAVSSVAPKGFEGNINQHLVSIKTESREISEALATFLNSDIGEYLASRRSTGGTRPALDYEALLSIPVIINQKIVDVMQTAYKEREEKLKQASVLYNSIGEIIKQQLGIDNLELKKRRIFVLSNNDVKGYKLNPNHYAITKDFPPSKKYLEKKLKEIATLKKGQSISKKNIVAGNYPVIAGGQTSPYSIDKYNFTGDVITVSASGAYSGYVWFHQYPIFASDCIIVKSQDEQEVSTYFMYLVMKTKQQAIYQMQQGAGQPHVYTNDLGELNIPVPPLELQKELSAEIKNKYYQVEKLRTESLELIDEAKKNVELMILS